ncbi:relaxase/mobilization nuclease domain-containing protein [Asticcacaulis tiandongensis]|uniref:relaxase/mobilization nuclease domain-containing protein n=1 Tax=Asticcacaulis tiandongensis TaxID=2565365 RepID=UPI001125ECCC|nr:hypothetical protein [Asticcacaulis tiandongensis]
MSLPKAYVDGFLIDWEDGEYEAQVQMLRARSKSAMTVVGRRSVSVGNAGGKGRGGGDPARRAQAIRERLDRTIRKVPEVMVKITSSCNGLTEIGRHISYISRKGQIALEDQDGCILSGKDQLADLREEWRYGGVRPLGEVSDRRDTLNLVFSMPAMTDEAGLKRAVRAFAQSEFDGHQYVFAYHTPSTDPDPDPPDHAHIHLCLRMEGPDGKRLNPRKADLQRWREGFAAELRSHGVEANATTRLARLKRTRGSARAIKAMEAKGRGQPDIRPPEPSSPRVEKAQRLEQRRLEYYYAASRILAESEDPADRHLAVRLAKHIQTLASPDRVKPVSAPTRNRSEPER